jgi:K(+)-stimulated pyrophosphate-energized sodium pump
VKFFNGAIDGHKLLLVGVVVSILGMGFGLWIYAQLKNMPVHKSMLDISELIYATCKSYMIQQGKFLMLLWVFIAAIVGLYFGRLVPTLDDTGAVVYGMPIPKVAIILAFSLVGIAGSYGVAWFGIRVNTFANSRAAFASLKGKPFPCYAIPLKAGMSIGMALISVELLIMLGILLFMSRPTCRGRA